MPRLYHAKQLEAIAQKPNIVWWVQGEGKSRVGLKIYIDLNPQPPSACLVVCRRKAFDSWTDEIRKVGFNAYVTEFNEVVSPARPTVWLMSHAMLERHLNRLNSLPIQLVILDELYLYSNPKAKRTKAAVSLSKVLPGAAKVGLSGTIMPAKDNLSIWGQCSAVGIHTALASCLTDFYNRYKRSFLVDYGRGEIRQWTNAPNSYSQIIRRLGDRVHIHFPKSKRQIVNAFREFEPTDAQRRAIRQLKDEYYLHLEEHGMELELRSALELCSKVSQISNGFLTDRDGNIAEFPSRKLTALQSELEEIDGCGERCVVWCYFRRDLEVIQKGLKIKSIKMSGDRAFDVDAWNSRAANVVLATVGSGASVNWFNQVQLAKFFSLSFKWMDYDQARMRTNRYDSEHSSCHYDYYFTKGTFDRHIYNVVTSSGQLEQSVIKQWLQNDDK